MSQEVRPSFPEVRGVLKKGLRVTISLVYQTLGIVAAEEPVVLQRSGVPGTNRFHALGGETLEFLKLAMVDLEPSNDLKLAHSFLPLEWCRNAQRIGVELPAADRAATALNARRQKANTPRYCTGRSAPSALLSGTRLRRWG